MDLHYGIDIYLWAAQGYVNANAPAQHGGGGLKMSDVIFLLEFLVCRVAVVEYLTSQASSVESIYSRISGPFCSDGMVASLFLQ